jgi:hypothetical protein
MSKLNVKMDKRVEEVLKSSIMNVVEEVISLCASRYNFDASEAKSLFYPVDIMLVRESVKKDVVKKYVAKKSVALPFPLPFSGVQKEEWCHALRQNNGLYTQCGNEKCESDRYCGQCSKQAEKSETGAPEYGTIESRMSVGLHDYVDSKGRKPVHYTKIMKKLNLTEAQVMELANKHGVKVDSSHFVAPVDASKRGRPKSEKAVNSAKSRPGVKGRPKKEKKVVQIAGDEDDLFANLVAQANQVASSDSDSDEEAAAEVAVVEVPAAEVAVVEAAAAEVASEVAAAEVAVVEVPAAKTAKPASDKAAEKAAKEAQKAAEKAAKEAEKASEKAAKEAEKAAKEAAKEAEKAAKEAAKEAEKAAKVAEKEAQKAAKGAEKTAKVAEKVAEKAAKVDDEAEVVKKIEFAGNKYLKSKKTGIVYDYAEYMKTGDQIVVGQWNNDTSAIDFKKACDDEEESEEEYEA